MRIDQEELEVADVFRNALQPEGRRGCRADEIRRPARSQSPLSFSPATEIPEVAEAADPEISEPASAAPAERTPLQVALDTDETLDAKSVVAHVSRLPGVKACAIVFSDGLSLAGNIPDVSTRPTLSARWRRRS